MQRILSSTSSTSADFNARLNKVIWRLTVDVQQALGRNLVALILGGGYGRGEGGMVLIDGIEQPYNDLDLTLVVQRKRAVCRNALATIKRKYEAILKIHVDFGRPLTVSDIQHWPCWLMWWDLLRGHIVLAGAPDILQANASATLQAPLPLIEATRLLLNRGAGLLWALRVIRNVEPAPDADFVRRNYYKCALGLGDALLIAHQRFATPYRGRDERLAQLMMDVEEVAALRLGPLYGAALRFKFRPDSAPEALLDEGHVGVLADHWGRVFLYIERQRTGRQWSSLQEWTDWGGLREPELHVPTRWLGNMVQNTQLGTCSWRYPRERLYRQLPILLGLVGGWPEDWPTETAHFLATWKRFN